MLLVDLVQGPQHRSRARFSDAEMLQDALQQLAVVDADAEFADRHLLKHAVDDARDLGLGEIAQRIAIDDVDVALVELAEPASSYLRVFAAPHPLDLIAAKRKRKLALAHGDVAREWNGQVEAQSAFLGRFVFIGPRGQASQRIDLLLEATLEVSTSVRSAEGVSIGRKPKRSKL